MYGCLLKHKKVLNCKMPLKTSAVYLCLQRSMACMICMLNMCFAEMSYAYKWWNVCKAPVLGHIYFCEWVFLQSRCFQSTVTLNKLNYMIVSFLFFFTRSFFFFFSFALLYFVLLFLFPLSIGDVWMQPMTEHSLTKEYTNIVAMTSDL